MALTFREVPYAFAATPSPAELRAQPIVDRGLEEMRRSNYREALDAFKQAYDIWPTPSVAARMGLAEQGLGEWIDAERHVQTALQVSTDKFINRNRAVLEKTLTEIKGHLGKLTVEGFPAGAVVRIDGITRGVFPKAGPIGVVSGTRTIDLSAPGHVDQHQMVDVAARKEVSLRIDLVPMPGTVTATSPGQSPDNAALETPTTVAESDNNPSDAGWTLRQTAWISMGLGTGVAVGGWLLFQNATEGLTEVEQASQYWYSSEYLPLVASGLGAAMAIGGLSYLVLDTLLVPVAGPNQVGIAATSRF
ncbi:MAG: PEGA domain-containing protein [Deltaproteobacteria bacterium]|nr:PEGA domain-containing protein [Deltaproteobacteria bacterium]